MLQCDAPTVTTRHAMYNKLFTKILDSSIWLAPDPVRLVWITLIAAMDEDGNCMFACAANVAARARVTVEQAEQALSDFSAPDRNSGDPENEGRRIERIPGGWHLLNAHKYRAMVTKAIIREQTRQRTAKYRQRDASVTHGDENERKSDVCVTPSEALALSEEKKECKTAKTPALRVPLWSPPEWVPADKWASFVAMRKAKGSRAPFTEAAREGIIAALDKLRVSGHNIGDVLQASVVNGWSGVFAPKQMISNGFGKSDPSSTVPSRSGEEAALYREQQDAHSAEVERQRMARKKAKEAFS